MIEAVLGNIDIQYMMWNKVQGQGRKWCERDTHNSEKRGEAEVAMEDTKVKVKDENQNETKADEMVPDWLWGGCNHKYDHVGTLCQEG